MSVYYTCVDCRLQITFCWHWEEVQVKGFQGKFEFSYGWKDGSTVDTQPAALVRVSLHFCLGWEGRAVSLEGCEACVTGECARAAHAAPVQCLQQQERLCMFVNPGHWSAVWEALNLSSQILGLPGRLCSSPS